MKVFRQAIFILVISIFPTLLLADSFDQSPTTNSGSLPALGRDVSMPPVLPGEDVTTSSGRKVKVWSTAGAVAVSSPHTPPTPDLPTGAPQNGAQGLQDVLGEGTSIILDAREQHR